MKIKCFLLHLKTLSKLSLIIAGCFFKSTVVAQEISNVLFVGKDGITENIKEAKSIKLVKNYPDNIFERLDYNMGGPLIMLRTYNDSNLSQLHGTYLEYHPNGTLQLSAKYKDNHKEGFWYYYDDTSKHIFTKKYKAGELVKTELPDTVKKIKDTITHKDEREAFMKSGGKGWISYLQKNLNPAVAILSKKGGEVRVSFAIDTSGNVVDVFMKKSVEYVLDEEAIRVIRNAPPWVPAFQNGKPIKAYRLQPLTFFKEE